MRYFNFHPGFDSPEPEVPVGTIVYVVFYIALIEFVNLIVLLFTLNKVIVIKYI